MNEQKEENLAQILYELNTSKNENDYRKVNSANTIHTNHDISDISTTNINNYNFNFDEKCIGNNSNQVHEININPNKGIPVKQRTIYENPNIISLNDESNISFNSRTDEYSINKQTPHDSNIINNKKTSSIDLNDHFINKFSYRRPFSKEKRKFIFLLIFIIDILINCDHGALPAAIIELKKEFNYENSQVGMIGSAVYLGLLLGSLSGGYILSTYSSKWVMIISLILCSFFLHAFTFINASFGSALCRVGCGFCQVFCTIYFPLWVDQYGVKNYQTMWMTFLQLAVPIGTMVGYLNEALFIKYGDNWRGAFYSQIILILIASFILALTPDKFFHRFYRHSDTTKEETEKEFKSLKEGLSAKNTNRITDYYKVRNMELIANLYDSKYGRPSLYSIYSLIEIPEIEGKEQYFHVILELIKNKKYICIMLGISCMLFVVTGFQYWITDYMLSILKLNLGKIYVIYIIVCLTAPTLGVLSGGVLITYLGGYTNKKALDACYNLAISAAICILILPLFNITFIFILFMWLLLFFGGSITPGLTGIMIASIPQNHKEIGNSFTNLCYNLIGYLPSPLIYGLVCRYTGGAESRWGLVVLVFGAFCGVVFLFLARQTKSDVDDLNYEAEENSIGLNEKLNDKEIILKNMDNIYDDFGNNNNACFGDLNVEGVKNPIIRRKMSIKDKSNILTNLFGKVN